jgi:hypothetical protein
LAVADGEVAPDGAAGEVEPAAIDNHASVDGEEAAGLAEGV